MATSTTNLKLYKYNTATDGTSVFSIENALNANWDKIDTFAATCANKSLSNLDTTGENRFTNIWTELNKKLEAEVSLGKNGYIKFNSLLSYTLQKLIKFMKYLYNITILLQYPIFLKNWVKKVNFGHWAFYAQISAIFHDIFYDNNYDYNHDFNHENPSMWIYT